MKMLTVRLSEELHTNFKTICLQKKQTMSKAILDFITDEVKTNDNTITGLSNIQEEKEENNFLLDRLKKAFGVDETSKNTIVDVDDDNSSQPKFHFVEISKSYRKPYQKLELRGFDVYSTRLLCPIQTILQIKEDIPLMSKTNNLTPFAKKYDINMFKFRRIIWNIEEGNFDEVIAEYSSRRFSFENRNNFLYINGEYTGLSLQKCRVMIYTLINESDVQGCVNGFIKIYPHIKPKHIRILCDEYNNPNLNKILKREAMKIDKVDNPQKRKEQGMV